MLTCLFGRIACGDLVEQCLDLALTLRQLLGEQMQPRHEHERVSRASFDHAGLGWHGPPAQLLDHVLLPAAATDVSVSVPRGGTDWAAISDHLPVTVRFSIPIVTTEV
jgi:endonuclease/exonuclease/phosphatase family metal-dependent hydrolase